MEEYNIKKKIRKLYKILILRLQIDHLRVVQDKQ